MKILLKILFFFSILVQINSAQWYQQTSGTSSHLSDIDCENNFTSWAVGTNGTIIKTSNGGNLWVAMNSGTSQNLVSIDFVNSNTLWAAGDSLTILKTTNSGMSWVQQPVPGNIINLSDITFANTLTGWAVGNYYYSPPLSDGYIYKTTNGGTTWAWLEGIMDEKIHSVFFLDANLGWISGSTIVKTTDGGLTWSYQENRNDKLLEPDYYSIYFVNSSTGWVAGKVFNSIGTIMKTTDGGSSWNTIYTDSGKVFNSIYFKDQNIGWCTGSSRTILYTTNGGNNWVNQIAGTAQTINSICFPVDTYGWAAGTAGTILYTANSGTPVELTSFTAEAMESYIQVNWSTATETNNSGFEVQRSTDGINFLRIEFVNGKGTTTDVQNYSYKDRTTVTGKYYYRLKQIDYDGSYQYSKIIEVDLNSPDFYSLEQNYPNPFNPNTVISFSINELSYVRLSVYNSLGQETSVLINEERPAGRYTVYFDASDLAAGVYYYQLNAGAFSDTRKMILMR